MIVRGTTATRDELTGNLDGALEDTSIGDYRLIALFAEKTLKAIFGVLQHYPLKSRRPQTAPKCRICRPVGSRGARQGYRQLVIAVKVVRNKSALKKSALMRRRR